jgi:hypothetical protein
MIPEINSRSAREANDTRDKQPTRRGQHSIEKNKWLLDSNSEQPVVTFHVAALTEASPVQWSTLLPFPCYFRLCLRPPLRGKSRLAQDPAFSVGFDDPLSQSTGRAGQAEAACDTCDRISHHAPASSSATRAGGPPMEQREAQRQAELEPSVPPKVRLVSLPLSCRAGWSKESVPWVRGAGFWGGERAWRRTLMRFRCAFFICSVIDWLLDVM